MSYTEALVEQGKRSKSLFSQRFVDFLQAGLDPKTVELVNFNVISYQKRMGTLRDDRVVKPKRETMSRVYFEGRQDVLMMNESDAQVMKQLEVYQADNSLDMDETAGQWFVYITEGTIAPAVAKDLVEDETGEFGF